MHSRATRHDGPSHKAGYLLALKGNQPTLKGDVADDFRTAPPAEVVSKTTVEKRPRRLETPPDGTPEFLLQSLQLDGR